VAARTKLLGYYRARAYTSAEARTARQQQILWLIRNQAEAPILDNPEANLDPTLDGPAYAEGKKAWLEQVDRQPKNTTILGHAAAYLLLYDSATAESLYKRAEAAEPQNPRWPERLGHLYELGLSRKSGEAREKAAEAALEAFERSLQQLKEDQARQALLSSVAKVALEAGEVAKARGYAEELLKKAGAPNQGNWNYGNAVHHGHVVLGRLALREGDVKKAREHLLAAGKTPGSPQLNSFGPNMTLAKELLKKGERQAVLEYFELCGKFWKRDQLESWSKEVRAGRIPDFGANLNY
jgi:tetratricopeptide (TPR) repeat protein